MPSGSNDREDKLLGAMMTYLMQGKTGVSFKQLSNDLNFMERTKSWRESWRILVENKHFLAPADGCSSTYTGDHELTQAGKDHASTPEYQEYLKELNFQPASNKEHQASLKKRLQKPKAKVIFDLLLQYGTLTRTELSNIIGMNDRSHSFSYGLQELVQKELVEVASTGKDGQKRRLADKAFLNPDDDRPIPEELDPELLKAGTQKISDHKRKTDSDSDEDGSKKKKKKKKSKKKKKKTEADGDSLEEKHEEDNLDDGEDSMPDEISANKFVKMEEELTGSSSDEEPTLEEEIEEEQGQLLVFEPKLEVVE
jgi:hypothetical protein